MCWAAANFTKRPPISYHFGPQGVSMANQTLVYFMTKASRLCEQARMGVGAPDALGMYMRRWLRWARAGIGRRFQRENGDPLGSPHY